MFVEAVWIKEDVRPGRTGAVASGQTPAKAENKSGIATAEEVLETLRRRRPVPEVVPPASAAVKKPTGAPRVLFPEGSPLVGREGRLTYEDPWWKFESDETSNEPPIKLLHNVVLEVMVRTAGGGQALTFAVSGEMTVFEGENYLLPQVALRAPEGALRAEAPTHPTASDAAPEDVLQILQKQRPQREAMPVESLSHSDKGGSGFGSGVAAMPDGAPLANRAGRLVREGGWWTFLFESDHPDHPEPPMRLMPNMTLEMMVKAAAAGGNGTVFIVSGEVTLFHGRNYLLPRMALRRIDAGNLHR